MRSPLFRPIPTPIPTPDPLPDPPTPSPESLYPELKILLKDSMWEAADLKTRSIMLKASGKQKDSVLTIDDISSISCESIYSIDRLWSEYSGGKFGLRIQSNIWDASSKDYTIFSDRVGWLNNGSWLKQDNSLNSLSRGSLPRAVWWGIMDTSQGAEVTFKKIDACNRQLVGWLKLG